MSVFWIPVIAITGGIAMVIVVTLAGMQTRQRQAELRADVQMKLIDRFGTADEFVQFIKSQEGKQFLGDAPQKARSAGVSGIRGGIILAFVGASFAVLGGINDRDWFVPAFILLGLGLGFFVSAIFSMKVARDLERNLSS